MKNSRGLFIGLLLATSSHAVLADEDSIGIPQVSDKASDGENYRSESTIYQGARDTGQSDYQKQILSNPEISDIGRANALTSGGGNTAIITQEGNSNHSTITQRGKSNYARQTQQGRHNDMYLNQQGNRNESEEDQTGDYSHKIIIQNGHREESPPFNENESDE